MLNLENLDVFEILVTQKTAKMPEGPFCQIGAHICRALSGSKLFDTDGILARIVLKKYFSRQQKFVELPSLLFIFCTRSWIK